MRAIDATTREKLAALLDANVCFDEPLARHTSLRVGGPADAFARPGDLDELRALLALCAAERLPVTILGQGFNTLVRDGGVRGVVVHLQRFRTLEWSEDGTILAGAGVTHTALTKACLERGRSGLEFGVGIPGCVGGWIRMNAGTREREMKDIVESVQGLDPASGERSERSAAQLHWHYRGVALPADWIVLAARFRTAHGDSAAIRAAMDAQLAARRATQPVHERSCGSVFKNPPGQAAGHLIDEAGLKGFRVGGAEISALHANFIVTRGPAKAADVLALIEHARDTVAARSGTRLDTEVQIVGENP
jgi:UDP-N-acetylmuramate dehydrogenase